MPLGNRGESCGRPAWPLLMALAFACSSLVPAGVPAEVSHQEVSDQLRGILESAALPLDLELGGESVLAAVALPAFYEQSAYRPVFVSDRGPLPPAFDLVEFLATVDREGLNPEEYHLERLRELLDRGRSGTSFRSSGDLVELEILLTDAFLMLGAHLVSGRVDPATFDREWSAVRREVDLVQTLSLETTRGGIRKSLSSLLPDHAGYFRLRKMGEQYRQLVEAGGWQAVSDGPALRVGDRGVRVAELQRRLSVTEDNDLQSLGSAAPIFDERLERAVQGFQNRHGLEEDGVVGAKTLAAVNVSAEERLQQIYLNLERWRWLPQSLGERYVLVNLPAFDLRAVEERSVVLEMRVVVGRRYRRTPVFSDTIRYLVFNPYWDIPTSIAVLDKLPEVQKDSFYLEGQGIRVFSGWAADQQEIDPSAVDWQALGPGNFPYRLRQDPGPLNALGRVKFMFPNRFNVYLHDTPGREVFKRADRDISSGCIRLEKPLELAQLLLRDNPDWRAESIEEFLRDYRERTVRLATPWPVHLLHWTAWVDEEQVPHFRSDLYERDRKLAAALGKSLPGDDS